jgi:hypothetical protein
MNFRPQAPVSADFTKLLNALPDNLRPMLLAAVADMMQRNPDQILPTEKVAELTCRSVRSLEADRQRGAGIPYVQLSAKRIGYRLRDVSEYLASRVVRSTSAATVAKARAGRRSAA